MAILFPRFVFPHQSLMFAPVTGSVDASYEAAWLTDGRPNFPVRTTGDLALSVAPAATQSVDVIAVCQHAIRQAATITLGGDVSGVIPTAAYPPDGIPYNWVRILADPVPVDTLTIGVAGNTDPVVIGLLYAGLSFQPEVGFQHGRSFDPGQPFAWEGEFGIIAPYDPGLAAPRRWRGELLLSSAEFDTLVAGYQATRNGTRPILFVPDDAVNDAWLGILQFTETTDGYNHFVTVEVAELPRVRW